MNAGDGAAMSTWISRPVRAWFGKDFARLLSGTALGQALIVIATPILSRLYSPADFGQFAVLLAFVGFVSVSLSLRFEMALVGEMDDRQAAQLLRISLELVPLTALVWTASFVVLNRLNLFELGALPAWAAVAVLLILVLIGAFSALRYWHVRAGKFDDLGRALAFNGLGRAVMPIATGAVRSDWVGLVLGELLGRALGIARLWKAAAPALAHTRVARAPAGPLWRKYWKYPGVLLPSSLLDALGQNLGVPLVAALFGIVPAGQYALIHRLAQAPAALIGASAADVLHWQLSTTDSAARRGLVLRQAAKLAGASLVIYGAAAVAAHWLTVPVLGADWGDAGRMFVILFPAYCALFVVSPLSRALLLTQRIELKFIADFAALLLPLAAMLVFRSAGIWIAFGAFMIASVAAAGIYFALIMYAMRPGEARGAVT